MRERILEELKKVETEFEVKICYAVEAGSRAWGLSSKDSDYDVRFLYVHKKEWYLSIDEKRDVIEIPINNQLDISGWDVRKALRLFRKSNPPLMEWLHSRTIYDQAYSLVGKMKTIQNKVFSPKSSLHHYLQMAKRNNQDFLQKEHVKIKKYFYVLRPILACQWIEQHGTVPPVEFNILMEKLLPENLLKQAIHRLIVEKISGEELDLKIERTIINDFVKKEIERIQTYINSLKETKGEDMTPELDNLFRETLHEAWL
ncbi:nucleotidyltransferase domain-containing protein [Neobacillus fumarioli]|uniref:nucleotidyltransferase domain-containing protein n=1 Tax=Neobacillus fumarioli TaxID=105229 RepID=UPI0008326A67|nr:nucleotidyltransferase domain-containing protein [Neobacillus fumarioli]